MSEQEKLDKLVAEKRHLEIMEALKGLLAIHQLMIELLTKISEKK
jgi:hypothetical protein